MIVMMMEMMTIMLMVITMMIIMMIIMAIIMAIIMVTMMLLVMIIVMIIVITILPGTENSRSVNVVPKEQVSQSAHSLGLLLLGLPRISILISNSWKTLVPRGFPI